MRTLLTLERLINGGFVLENENLKYILSIPKKNVPGVIWALKQVKPFEEYLTGLFKTDKGYTGKTKDGKKVTLKLYLDYAELVI